MLSALLGTYEVDYNRISEVDVKSIKTDYMYTYTSQPNTINFTHRLVAQSVNISKVYSFTVKFINSCYTAFLLLGMMHKPVWSS